MTTWDIAFCDRYVCNINCLHLARTAPYLGDLFLWSLLRETMRPFNLHKYILWSTQSPFMMQQPGKGPIFLKGELLMSRKNLRLFTEKFQHKKWALTIFSRNCIVSQCRKTLQGDPFVF